MFSFKAVIAECLPSLFGSKDGASAVPLERPDLLTPLTKHLEAMAALANLEIKEYQAKLIRKVIAFCFASLFLFVGYIVLCWACILWLSEYWGIRMACLTVGGVQFLLGLVLLLIVFKRKLGSPMPDTCDQLKSDYECLKLSLEKNKSCS